MARPPSNQDALQAAWQAHTERVKAYYAHVVEPARAQRRAGNLVQGYVQEMPPRFEGERPKSLAVQRPDLPTRPHFIAAAKQAYGFVPRLVDERSFKRRYAQEALRAGITCDEMVGVYAFETGGTGKFDMQPIPKGGYPISTATGYAQLLNTNSIRQIQLHGKVLAARLEQMARQDPQRAVELKHKASIVRRMQTDAAGIPAQYEAATGRASDNWNDIEWFAKFDPQRRGRAMHALLYDADVGPMIQAIKLAGIKKDWDKAFGGSRAPTPAELEMLNLLGEKPGLLIAKNLKQMGHYPITNFIDAKGYLANPIVQDKTAAELLARIGTKMQEHVHESGSRDLARAYAEVSGTPTPQRPKPAARV